jgi:hypothetical protein
MTTGGGAARAIRLAALVGAAIGVGIVVTIGAALLAHQALVLKVGEEGIPAIDDTPLMFALVGGAYLAGVISGVATLVYGWRRFIR